MTIENICGRATGVKRLGQGEPALLMHCSLAHSGAWGGVMNLLNDRLDMVAVDLPGHGRTEFDSSVDIQDQACETAITLLEQFNKPAHLIGHSFGATVALRCAMERPDLVASLSLYEAVYVSFLAEKDPQAFQKEITESRLFVEHAENGDWEKTAAEFLRRWGAAGGLDIMPLSMREYVVKTMPMVLQNTRSVIDPNGHGKKLRDVASVKVPCLLMEGASSPESIVKINDLIARNLPNPTRKVLQTASHMGPITHPKEVAAEIREFLFGDKL